MAGQVARISWPVAPAAVDSQETAASTQKADYSWPKPPMDRDLPDLRQPIPTAIDLEQRVELLRLIA